VHSFARVTEAVREAGILAKRNQSSVSVRRKEDGSVVTEMDLEIERRLSALIHQEFPQANIISEEYPTDFRAGRSLNFTIDPIDGTDSYSQGMPGWCVGVGILDGSLSPVGGFVFAPRWGKDADRGVFLQALPDQEPYWEGLPDLNPEKTPFEGHQLMIGSKVHRRFDFSSYPGKVRNVGSSIIHILSPIIHNDVEGTFVPPSYIWDIVPAHGIARRFNLCLEYANKEEIDYAPLVHRQIAAHHIVCGGDRAIENIRSHLRQL